MKKPILFTGLAIFLVQLDATILFIAFSSISQSFPSAAPSLMAWVLNIYTLAFGSLLIPAGAAGDRFGRKRIFLVGTTIFTAASFLCGISGSIEFLIAMRLLQAVGAALLVPTSLALLLQSTAAESRPVAVSIWGALGALGAAFGPALGGLLISSLGWHWIFFVNVPIGLFVVIAAQRGLENLKLSSDRNLPSPVGVGLVVGAMALLSYVVLSEGGGADGSAKSVFGLAGTFLLGAFLWHCHSADRPLMDLGLFRQKNFSLANLGTFLYFIAFSIFFFGNVQSLVHEWHQSVTQAGLALIPGPIAVIPSAILSGRYAKKHGYQRILTVGSLVVVSGLLLQQGLHHDSGNPWLLWLPGWILLGIGNGMVAPSLAGSATVDLPQHRYSEGAGVNNSVRQFGSLMGIAIAVALTGAGNSSHTQYLWMFGLAAAFTLVVGALGSQIGRSVP